MKRQTNLPFNLTLGKVTGATLALLFLVGSQIPCRAQQLLGSINGTVLDSTGAVVGDAEVKSHNVGTNMEVEEHSKSNGTYVISNLPAGTYTLTFTKTGFETETHTEVLVSSDRATTVDASLKIGQVSTTVEVTDVALMNQTDPTNGYVVDQLTIQDTPLGTGSFTQLAILTPGVHADFLEGSGSNAGLGNQAIYANGNRDTSNSFSINGVGTNNLFNGNSTSSVGENRFLLNTGENFGVGGEIQTNSVYAAIGQALPTPPPDAIQEITVNAAMFDATQGNNSGAHIGVVTKSGTNQFHGSAWENWQNSDMNAAPFFYNASPALTTKIPYENRNQFGVTVGGPIIKNKVFFFGSYQGIRTADALDSTQGASVPLGLTGEGTERTASAIATAYDNSDYGNTISAGSINPVSLALLQATLPSGQPVIPAATLTEPEAGILGYDAIVRGPNAQAKVDQAIGNVDYQVNDKDRLSGKYYFQNDPTTDPFGYETPVLGFPQTLAAGSQVFTLSNNIILSPTITWEQHVGFTRMRAYSSTGSDINPETLGMSLLGSTYFPLIDMENTLPGVGGMYMGPSPSFANGGMFQNQWEFETAVNMVKGRHTLQMGGLLDHTQLNIVNDNTKSDYLVFSSFENFLTGKLHGGDTFAGAASRYYRSDTAGLYANDNFKVRSNLTLTGGIRWDFDGALSEKYGKLTGFNPKLYSFDETTDTITNDGFEFASNNPNSATPGASRTLMTAPQWGVAPRIGIAWSPYSKMTLRAGYGMYFDRGEFFTFLSPPAGSGFNGPFGVTLAAPFVEVASPTTATGGISAPFGTTPLPNPPGNAASFLNYLPNESQTGSGHFPAGNLFGPFEFGGYDINNKLPYTQNWTLDLQYQFGNNWLFDIAYVGNHGTHEVLPIPFNQPGLATPTNPIHGQTSSYGGTDPGSGCNNGTLDDEPLCPGPFYAGNAEVRVPYIGYDMNSVLYEAEGISNYHALQVQVRKRFSKGLQFTASYTYSHALDEQSGGGLFFNGNNPLVPKSNYASADFDQTHVFLINYSYTLPKLTDSKGWKYAVNGWTIGGQTVAQSGQPYSVYDYSGSVAGIYYGTYDDVGNPSVPLSGAIKTKQAELQGTLGVNPATPVLNGSDFAPVFLQPGQDGVPPCDASGCDNYESVFGTTGRNIFRGPFQSRFDMSLAKAFPVIKDKFNLRFEADAFNIFNHPDFDTPNNDVDFFPYFEGPPVVPPVGHLGQIQHTIGSPRFLQLGLHLIF